MESKQPLEPELTFERIDDTHIKIRVRNGDKVSEVIVTVLTQRAAENMEAEQKAERFETGTPQKVAAGA